MIKLVLAFTVFCAVITKTTSERNGYDGRYSQPIQGYTKIKRGKYYSSSPQRFHSRPPIIPKGTFSYTPPPNYMMEDELPHPGNQRQVSKRPSYDENDGPPMYPGSSRPSKRPTNGNEGLGDEDLQNFVKYLSKQDLDKIIEFAGYNKDSAGHTREDERSKVPYEKEFEYRPTTDEYKSIYNSIQDSDKFSQRPNDDDTKMFSALVKEIDLDPKFNSYQDKNNEYSLANYVTEASPLKAFYSDISNLHNAPLDSQEGMQSQIAYNMPNNYGLFTDSKVMPDESLPRPVNLREEQDFEVSFTNNVPRVVKADSSSYKLENFGDLPLMNYNSKLDTLSSYHVPHYTVTSSKSVSSPSSYSVPSSYSAPSLSSRVPPVEPAPPPSAAKEQSDAHLKAVRIWSHKSKGTAYTLHNDGTLSLEKPGRPRGGYGYP